MTTYPHPLHTHRLHVNPWLVAVVGLSAALIGLASWVLVDRYAGGTSATQNATTLLDKFYAAASTSDKSAISALHTSNSVTWSNGTKIVGAQAIGRRSQALPYTSRASRP